jgi:hypothetical protein
VPISAEEGAAMRKALGFDGPTPYTITTRQGTLERVAGWVHLSAEDGGVAGSVSAADIGFDLPLCVGGVNPNAPFGLWQAGRPVRSFGVFEGDGYARLSVAQEGEFYVGDLVLCDRPELKLSLGAWTPERITVHVNNPTDAPIEATFRTPPAVKGLVPLRTTVTIEAGSSRVLTNGEPQRGTPQRHGLDTHHARCKYAPAQPVAGRARRQHAVRLCQDGYHAARRRGAVRARRLHPAADLVPLAACPVM